MNYSGTTANTRGGTGKGQSSELVATSASQRNWRGIGIALLVILVVCSLIVTAVVLLTPSEDEPRIKGNRITLDDILSGNFSYQTFNGTWISDFEFVYRNTEGNVVIYDADTRNTTTIVFDSAFKQVNALDWSLSPDRQFLLLKSAIFKVFRYSDEAKYHVYEIKINQFTPLTPIEGQHHSLQYASWSTQGNALVMVFRNDIYYKPSVDSELAKQITNTGIVGEVYNGVPDWVYEEEILLTNKALWFSGDGTMLCYATFNDSKVDMMRIPVYGMPSQVYPKIESIHYPKPGYPNPDVELQILNLNEPDSENSLQPPTSLQNQDHYFSTVRWIDNKTVSVVWMNRPQNISIITICTAPLWYCNESQQVNTGGQGWVDVTPPPLFSKNGSKYFAIIPAQDGSSGFYNQVALKTITDNRIDFLTHGKWEVTKIKFYDEANKTVYFIAAPEGKAGQRHLYRVNENLKKNSKEGECLTCHLGPDCGYVDATFSTQGKYFVLDCLGPAPPTIYLYLTKYIDSVAVLNSNSQLHEFVAGKAMPQIRTFRVPLERNFEAQVRLFLPPGLREGEITKYPLVVNVYAGPGSQLVSDRFRPQWGWYLASQQDMIYAVIDGRGSGFQGSKILFELYRQLGTVEVQDQITVTDYLKMHLPFVDRDRSAIWGASYGGYVAALVMANEKQVFNCGISVAPVTSWEYYDTAYTERYMGLPTTRDNKDGYDKASLINKASHFKSKKLFLIHGTRDDNVHFQQSMMFAKALVREGVLFRMQVYPDENHSLQNVKKHQLEVMEEYIKDCFKVEGQTEEIGLQSKKN